MSHSAPDPNDEHGSVYDGLLGTDTSQWAFGTDFEDPLAGVDTTVPADLDPAELAAYCLLLGDDALVLSHRLSRVVQQRARPRGRHRAGQHRARPARPGPAAAGAGRGRRPGRRAGAARGLAGAGRGRARVLPRGGRLPQRPAGRGRERRLRRRRSRGCCCSRPCGSRRSSGWSSHRDPVLAAIAAKGVKELTYHRDYAGRWFLTLAQGTEESRRRLLAGLTALWPLYDELRDGVRRRAGGRRRPRPGLRGRPASSAPRSRRWPAAATPRRSPGCSPRCRSSPARTPRGCGEAPP